MLRVPVIASLLISAVIVAPFAVLMYILAGNDVFSPLGAILGILAVTLVYSLLRMQVMGMMERCTIGGIMGSAFTILAFHNVGGWLGFQGMPELVFGALLFGLGVFEILSPYLFKQYWERKKEEWDQAALYWKRRRLERRKLAS